MRTSHGRSARVVLPATALAVLGLFLAACGSSNPSPEPTTLVPVLESTDTATGDVRLVLRLRERDGGDAVFPAGTRFSFRYLDSVEAGFRFRDQASAQTIPLGSETYYVSQASFDREGLWAIEVVASPPQGEPRSSGRLQFAIDTAPDIVRPGDPAPRSPSSILAPAPREQSSGDPSPDASLYRTSVVSALDQQRPFVVLFSNVDTCLDRARCQRALDQIERLAPQADLLAIHSQPFEIGPDGSRVRSAPDIFSEWRLGSDPWIFVVDADGFVHASFELVVTDDELLAALQAVAGEKNMPRS